MRKCEKCGKELEDIIDICPDCGYERAVSLEEQELHKHVVFSTVKKKTDNLKLHVADEEECSFKSLKREISDIPPGIFISLYMMIFAIVFAAIPFIPHLVSGSSINYSNLSLTFFGTLLFITGLAVFIVNVRKRRKYKRLIKKGIVVKNLTFEVLRMDRLMKVKAEYVDPSNNKLVFIGRVATYLIGNITLCDVIYNPNNPKDYILKHNID